MEKKLSMLTIAAEQVGMMKGGDCGFICYLREGTKASMLDFTKKEKKRQSQNSQLEG